MKGKRRLLIGLVLGMMIGWALGFLRLPHLEKNFSFLLGFIAALAVVSLLFLLLTVWNRNFLVGLISKKTVTGDSKSTRTHTLIWIMLVGVLVLGDVVGGLRVYHQNQSFQLQIQNQDRKMQEMAALVASGQKNNLVPLLRSMLEEVGEELKRNPGRTLRDTTIARIAALSFSFKPCKYIKDDGLSKKACSPERGQLLQALILMNIDSGSFARIKRTTVFAWADLRGTDLKGLDLSGINLQDANLEGADLSGANLKEADLRRANLWGANLNRANLSHTDLKRADLSWAQLNEATLSLANLDESNLTNAQLMKADLYDATFQWAQLDGALFNEANLTSVYFVGTNFTKVNLTQANLNSTDLRKANLSEAILVGVRLDKAVVDKNWLDKLKEWQPTGVKELREGYEVVNDSIDQFKVQIYRLRKI